MAGTEFNHAHRTHCEYRYYAGDHTLQSRRQFRCEFLNAIILCNDYCSMPPNVLFSLNYEKFCRIIIIFFFFLTLYAQLYS